ncbi:MAG TPA: hypothetical protein VL727_23330 [Puia sp.]|jgi:hypothetical protein|nr:hypothetical protein [Puia sp.]
MIRIAIGLIAVLFSGCTSNDRDKSGYHQSYRVCDGALFAESYTIVGGGAYGGDRVSAYLTDSVNFRIYLGTYITGNEAIAVTCEGDSVSVYRSEMSNKTRQREIVKTWKYSGEELRKSKKFE